MEALPQARPQPSCVSPALPSRFQPPQRLPLIIFQASTLQPRPQPPPTLRSRAPPPPPTSSSPLREVLPAAPPSPQSAFSPTPARPAVEAAPSLGLQEPGAESSQTQPPP